MVDDTFCVVHPILMKWIGVGNHLTCDVLLSDADSL